RFPGDPRLRTGASIMEAEIRVFDPEFLADRTEQAQLIIPWQGGEAHAGFRLAFGRARGRRVLHRLDAAKQVLPRLLRQAGRFLVQDARPFVFIAPAAAISSRAAASLVFAAVICRSAKARTTASSGGAARSSCAITSL